MSRLWIIYPVHNGRDYRKFITRRRGDGRWTTVRKEGREVISGSGRRESSGRTKREEISRNRLSAWSRREKLPLEGLRGLWSLADSANIFASRIVRCWPKWMLGSFYSPTQFIEYFTPFDAGDHPLIIRDSIKVGFLPNVYLFIYLLSTQGFEICLFLSFFLFKRI